MDAKPPSRLPLVGLALAAVAGIAVGDIFDPDPRFAVAVGLLCLVGGARKTWALLLATAAIFAAVHVWQWQDNPSRAWARAIAPEPRAVRVTGIIIDEPEPVQGSVGRWRTKVRTEKWEVDGRTFHRTTDLVARWQGESTPRYGDLWSIEGIVAAPEAPRNPGQFDARLWRERQNVFLELRGRETDRSRLIARDRGSAVKAAAIASREWIMRALGLGLENDESVRAVIAGITLGAREDAAESFADAFRQTGTMHLFSVSGLHVGMFGLLLWLALRPLGLTRRHSVLIIVPTLLFYAMVTGAQPASLRAAAMISIALGGLLLDRPVSTGNSLAAAALLLLGADTNQLFQPGFQLSFCVVASILLLAPFFDRRLVPVLRPDAFIPRRLYTAAQKLQSSLGRALAATLSVSLASWLGSLGLTAGYFHLVPLASIPTNMVAVPLAFAILALAMLAIIAAPFSSWVAVVFNNANWGATSALLAVVPWAASLPGAYLSLPPGWLLPPAQLTVFDLGTGGAQLLRTREQAWLLDTGATRDFESVVEPALRAAGIARLDALVLTHGDAGHIGGAPLVMESASPRRIFDSTLRDRSRVRRDFHAALAAGKIPKSLVLPGDRALLGPETSVEFLFPYPERGGRTADDQTIITRLDQGAFRILLMSDAGAETENFLLRTAPETLKADILVLGRHGDDLMATADFLAAVQPRAIILAAPDPFRDGSDEAALRERLVASAAQIFDQQECGAVTVTFSEDSAEVRGFLGGQAIEFSPR
ncbi:MAG: ComEC/Rec2 family competence protein [Chthoniobacterales bacterium]